MKLAFWKRNEKNAAGKRARSHRPRELSDRIGIYLVTQMKEDPDWVWSLRSVSRPRENNRDVHDIRIYDPRAARENQIEVEDFASLDGHPQLVLFRGLVNKNAGTVELEKTSKVAA
jgi:hypothetical protein